MGISHTLRRGEFGAIDQIIGTQICQHGHLGIEQSHVNVLTHAGALGMANRRQNGYGGIHASEQIGNSNAYFLRTSTDSISFTCDTHQAAHGLNREVITGSLAVGTGLAKACDAAIDQAGINGFEACKVQPVAGHVADFEILDKHMAV